jgi:hypothetical protein
VEAVLSCLQHAQTQVDCASGVLDLQPQCSTARLGIAREACSPKTATSSSFEVSIRDTASACPFSGRELVLGEPSPLPPNPRREPVGVPDGFQWFIAQIHQDAVDQLGSAVSCDINAQGNGYAINAAVVRVSGSASVAGSVDVAGHGAAALSFELPGSAGIAAPRLAGNCSLTVLPGNSLGTLSIGADLIWASFDCPSLDTGGAACAATGSFSFENCGAWAK